MADDQINVGQQAESHVQAAGWVVMTGIGDQIAALDLGDIHA